MTEKEIREEGLKITRRAKALNGGELIGCYKYYTNDDFKLEEELNARSMLNSILCYGGYPQNWRREYREKYMKYHTPQEIDAICEDQVADFKKRAKVSVNVYTDSEGLSYNSVKWLEKGAEN